MKWFINIYKIRKRTVLFFLAAFYIIILFCFGIIYWDVANDSNGEFFIFQNDINMNTKIEIFKKNSDIKVYSNELKNSIKNLISSDEYKRPVAKLETINNSLESINVFSFEKVLGADWANYYYLLLKDNGITHISLENLGQDKISGSFDTYKIKVCFYKMNEDEKFKDFKGYTKNQQNNFKKIYTKYIWVDQYPVLHRELLKKQYFYYPLNFYFPELMEKSISFLDDSPLVLKSIAGGNFKYPLWNFMYFSAVTMTTLGYGDIVPNSTIVRVLVMIETISGVMIIGVFASCLFWNKGVR